MTTTLASLEATIKADLQAGVSYLEQEALTAGLGLWNLLKGVFVALEPAEATILINALTAASVTAGTGASIESVETAALNSAKGDEAAVLTKAGSGIIQTVIAGIKANS